jgi:hypothetical protein
VYRSTYYAWKRQVDRHGLEMLRPRERRRPQMPNALPKTIEERIVSFSIAHLASAPDVSPRNSPGRSGRDHRHWAALSAMGLLFVFGGFRGVGAVFYVLAIALVQMSRRAAHRKASS